MPAAAMPARPLHRGRPRLVASLLAVAFLAGLGATSAAPVEARSWMREISATRASQIYYESAMRGADSEVRSLKHAAKHTRRSLRASQRRLRAAVERRATAKRRVGAARAALRSARAELAAPIMEPPPPPDAATAVLAITASIPSDPSAPLALERAFVRSATPPSAEDRKDITVADVIAMEHAVRRASRASQKAGRRARAAARNVRVRRAALLAIKARQRSATARREGAEAALGGRIVAMSSLAQRRIAKKTKVRPGINSGFIWPARGRLSQRYGCTGFALNPARGSCRHFHDGLDIAGYLGTPIRSAAVGVVSYVGWNPWDEQGRAFMVVVAHPGGYETLYGHVQPTRQVRVGQLVKRGEVIGYMGSTGHATGVHLHLELRRGHTTLDPLAFL